METTLARLQLAPEDAEAILRTLPSTERRRELATLFEPCLANREDRPDPPAPLAGDPLYLAHVILAALDSIRGCHREFGIPDAMSWATLAHLGRAMASYRAANGHAGIALGRWDWLRYFGWLYESGRLEVTPYRIRTHPKQAGPLFWYDDETAARLGPGFRVGDPALSLHIPAGGPLSPGECDLALRGLKEAFAHRYSEPVRIATCTAWLLDEELAGHLPADSNILAFQRRFQMVPGARETDAALAANLPKGRPWRLRTGWLELE
jgi:hypothetical protein